MNTPACDADKRPQLRRRQRARHALKDLAISAVIITVLAIVLSVDGWLQ